MVSYVMTFVIRYGDKEIYTAFWCGSLAQYCVQWHSLMLPVLNLRFLLSESQLTTPIWILPATTEGGIVQLKHLQIGTVKNCRNFNSHSISNFQNSSIHRFNTNMKQCWVYVTSIVSTTGSVSSFFTQQGVQIPIFKFVNSSLHVWAPEFKFYYSEAVRIY
jgi:hypothetical protein